MKKYTCPLCDCKFKTIEGFENHRGKDFIFTNYEGLILKNKHKFFIFSYTDQISRSHEILYHLTPIRIAQFMEREKDKFERKTSLKIPSSEIEKKLTQGRLEVLSQKEFDSLNKFLKQINPTKEYYGKKIKNYFRAL